MVKRKKEQMWMFEEKFVLAFYMINSLKRNLFDAAKLIKNVFYFKVKLINLLTFLFDCAATE